MSHFGRTGPPDIKDTYSLLVLNITFRTNADDLFPLFDKYGKVVDIFIPRDRRTGDSRGFAFVHYKYAEEAQKAVEKLDGRNVDGRDIMVQFAKYGPNAEPMLLILMFQSQLSFLWLMSTLASKVTLHKGVSGFKVTQSDHKLRVRRGGKAEQSQWEIGRAIVDNLNNKNFIGSHIQEGFNIRRPY